MLVECAARLLALFESEPCCKPTMLGERAARPLESSRQNRDASSSASTPVTVAVLTTEKRLVARWKKMCYKVLIILMHFETKNTVIEALGKQRYLRVFQQIRENEEEELEQQRTQNSFYRVIEGELMGNVLKDSATKQNQLTCSHSKPNDIIKERNRTSKWFRCVRCNRRWERKPLPDRDAEPAAENLMLFGRHAHLTYQQVYETKPNYVIWAREQAERYEFTYIEPHLQKNYSQLMRFNAWLTSLKHKGRVRRNKMKNPVLDQGSVLGERLLRMEPEVLRPMDWKLAYPPQMPIRWDGSGQAAPPVYRDIDQRRRGDTGEDGHISIMLHGPDA